MSRLSVLVSVRVCVCELEGCHVCTVPVWGTDFKSPQTVNKILNMSTEISLNISENLSV